MAKGKVAQVIGTVVDIEFPPDELPALYNAIEIETGGGKKVKDEEDLFNMMKVLLTDPERSSSMGRQAKEFVKMNSGALERVMKHLESYIDPASIVIPK